MALEIRLAAQPLYLGSALGKHGKQQGNWPGEP